MADKPKGSKQKSFGFLDFLWRWLAAIAMVYATYNPSGWSYTHWVREAMQAGGLEALHFFVGVILLAGWTVFIVATRNSLGWLGTIISAALVGTAIWLLADVGLVRAGSMTAVTWLGLFALATLLAIGLSWSHIWRRLSGQLEVDDDKG